ncbi:unnamed protein product, partial [Phaeothamnion confervicola]
DLLVLEKRRHNPITTFILRREDLDTQGNATGGASACLPHRGPLPPQPMRRRSSYFADFFAQEQAKSDETYAKARDRSQEAAGSRSGRGSVHRDDSRRPRDDRRNISPPSRDSSGARWAYRGGEESQHSQFGLWAPETSSAPANPEVCDLHGRALAAEDIEHCSELFVAATALDASLNSLTRLPRGLPCTLVHLNLSENHLERLEGFDALPQLQELDVSRNRLAATTGLSRNTRLRSLSFAGNAIRRVDGLEPLRELRDLDLSDNSLRTSVALRALSLNVGLRTLCVKGNPLCRDVVGPSGCSAGNSCSGGFLYRYRVALCHLLPSILLLDGRVMRSVRNAGTLSPKKRWPGSACTLRDGGGGGGGDGARSDAGFSASLPPMPAETLRRGGRCARFNTEAGRRNASRSGDGGNGGGGGEEEDEGGEERQWDDLASQGFATPRSNHGDRASFFGDQSSVGIGRSCAAGVGVGASFRRSPRRPAAMALPSPNVPGSYAALHQSLTRRRASLAAAAASPAPAGGGGGRSRPAAPAAMGTTAVEGTAALGPGVGMSQQERRTAAASLPRHASAAAAAAVAAATARVGGLHTASKARPGRGRPPWREPPTISVIPRSGRKIVESSEASEPATPASPTLASAVPEHLDVRKGREAASHRPQSAGATPAPAGWRRRTPQPAWVGNGSARPSARRVASPLRSASAGGERSAVSTLLQHGGDTSADAAGGPAAETRPQSGAFGGRVSMASRETGGGRNARRGIDRVSEESGNSGGGGMESGRRWVAEQRPPPYRYQVTLGSRPPAAPPAGAAISGGASDGGGRRRPPVSPRDSRGSDRYQASATRSRSLPPSLWGSKTRRDGSATPGTRSGGGGRGSDGRDGHSTLGRYVSPLSPEGIRQRALLQRQQQQAGRHDAAAAANGAVAANAAPSWGDEFPSQLGGRESHQEPPAPQQRRTPHQQQRPPPQASLYLPPCSAPPCWPQEGSSSFLHMQMQSGGDGGGGSTIEGKRSRQLLGHSRDTSFESSNSGFGTDGPIAVAAGATAASFVMDRAGNQNWVGGSGGGVVSGDAGPAHEDDFGSGMSSHDGGDSGANGYNGYNGFPRSAYNGRYRNGRYRGVPNDGYGINGYGGSGCGGGAGGGSGGGDSEYA